MKSRTPQTTARALLNLLAITVLVVIAQYVGPLASHGIAAKPVIEQDARRSDLVGAPVAAKAVAFAESPQVRRLGKTRGYDQEQNGKPGASIAESSDGLAAQLIPGARVPNSLDTNTKENIDSNGRTEPLPVGEQDSVSPTTLPTPSVSFEGISVFDTDLIGQGFLPPDTSGEAGPNHFVQAVNVAMRVWDKNGTPLTPVVSLGDLFEPLAGPCSKSLGGFPNVIYDQLADRWLIAQRCFEVLPYHYLVAVSKTPDPTGEYFLYDFMMPNTKHIDSPKLGVWPDGYYMTANQFYRTGQFFTGAGFYSFDRAKMLAGDPTAGYVYFDSCPTNLNCRVTGALPSDMDGFIPPPAGSPAIIAIYTAAEWNDPEGDTLRFFDFHSDFSSPDNSTFVERAGSPMPVSAFDPITGFVRQPGASFGSWLQTISGFLMFRMPYRRFPSGRESLIANHTVDVAGDDLQAGVRYYQLERTSPNAALTIAEQQTFAPDSHSRWMASGAMNYLGDTAIGYSVSSATVFPSLRYAARLASDPPGSGLAQGEQTIIAGGGSQFSSTRRWGTYSHMSIDPIDDCSFWYTNEYYAASNTNGWQTRIAKFAPRQCSISPRGAIQGAVTSCATGAPLQGVSVSASGGFSRETDLGGGFSMSVSPGSYTILAKKLGYVASPIEAVQVADGQTVIRNLCMAPVATFVTSNPNVTTGNALIEPNECNLVNIPVTNNGALTATAVTATLTTTTPGVTITSGTSAYPNIAANGGVETNITPFQVSTGATIACLSEINLILTINYAGTGSPVVKNIKLKVGQPKGPNYVFTASTESLIPGGTLIPGSADALAVSIPAPFNFSLYGKPVTQGQPIWAHEFGVAEINTNLPNPFPINTALPTLVFESPTGVLLPYWDDLEMRSDSVVGSGIFTIVSGTAPNRTLQIEWRARNVPGNFTGPVDTIFGVQFHENSDDFDYIYSQTGISPQTWNGLSATVGVQGLGYGTNFTQHSYLQQIILPGMKLTGRRPAAICNTGSGQCNAPTVEAPFDFDGDGKTDIGIFRPNGSASEWWVNRSGNGQTFALQFGASTDRVTPADYTGDGKTDIAFYRPSSGEWYVLRSEDFSFFALPFGTNGDVPVPADYDADGKADFAVFRPSNSNWYISQSSGAPTQIFQFGITGDAPVVADYDGDGKADVGVFRQGAGGAEWWIQRSAAGSLAMQFGANTDKAVQGDYTGDGKADVAIWRPSNGNWLIVRSEDFSFFGFPFGASGDVVAPGDYDGDGKFDATVFRPSSATWFIGRTTGGTQIVQFGAAGDLPLPSSFVP